MPWLDGFAGWSSTPAMRPSPSTCNATPQPTPQYGHTDGTSRRLSTTGCAFGERAPVGHTDTHWPHDVQIESMTGRSMNAAIRASRPVPAIAIAPMCCTSWQASTQRAQRMHALKSDRKNGLLSSTCARGLGAYWPSTP